MVGARRRRRRARLTVFRRGGWSALLRRRSGCAAEPVGMVLLAGHSGLVFPFPSFEGLDLLAFGLTGWQ